MQKIVLGSIMLAGAGTTLTFPAKANSADINLPETVVTATRTETARNELATATTVFTREDIEKRQVRTLPELLKTAPGIDMTEQGGYGKNTSIFMRGTNSDHILVLIDGIKAGSVTSGTAAFQFIPIDQIERVEIIRGPQSSLYGSEAIGGVIQIFTRKGAQTDKPSVTLETGAGSFDTFTTSGTVSGKWQNSWYTLGASHMNSQGIDARQPTTGAFGINEPDRDGYYNTAVNARAGHRFDNNAEIEAFFMRSFGKTEFDGTPNKTDFVNQVVGTTASFDVLDNWRSTLRFGQTQDDSDNFRPNGSFNSRFNSTRWNASWLNNITLTPNHQATLGTDYRLDEVQSSTRYNETSRYDVGVFGELHSRLFDDHFLNASLRWDDNQAFGESVTGNFGWRYNWKHGLSAFASFGNAFKAPTFNQLYFPNYGNPNLKAEKSTSFEAGIAGTHDLASWELRAYHTNIDNLIAIFPVENVDKAQIDGIEGEVSTQLFGWNNSLNMALLSPRDRLTNLTLARRSSQTLSYDVSRSFDAVDVGAHVLAQGSRFDDRANQTKVSGFVTVDLRAAYRVNKNWVLSAKLNNLLDKQYQTVDTYNNFGRNFFFTIHYNN
ncbi:TonB-dependent receptor domain-containing protein [Methylomonas methanica]|uniref:TonB-dependent receptor plug n=1 Tax=Methylomonas methanica (strain DSM 25384 / MC09) TaxID=857087 RepID=G0A0M3_METMM|nr:TonB-dependent receptor [Methylomonas methanica]AEF98799.1 TonB-dependent receptor plug [Methylomonas methanica MC09]